MLLSLAAPLSVLAFLLLTFGPESAVITVVGAIAIISLGALLLSVLLWLRLPRMTKGSVAFFHPNSSGGGGGERVLWVAIQALQKSAPWVQVVIYTKEGFHVDDLVSSAARTFNLQIASNFKVVPLQRTRLLSASTWPRFTLIGQSLGSLAVAFEGLQQMVPEVFVDTTGWAFMYPLARLAGCRVAAYTHYPTVSTDMLARVYSREEGYNNDAQVTASVLHSAAKVVYYYLFAAFYGAAGGCANVSMVNSSWTQQHIQQLWWALRPPARVFPPCDTTALNALPLDRKLKRLYLVSVAQFRPEKNHALQLRAYALARRRAEQSNNPEGAAVLASRLKLVGGCRDAGDEARVAELQALARQLGIAEHVDFCVNLPHAQLRELLADAVGGLHTMRDEHFGISVVEYMAAGVVPIAHDSAGPKEDIVGGEAEEEEGLQAWQRCGYLCSSVEEYAAAITELLAMDQFTRLKMAGAARRRARRFSDERFVEDFLHATDPILPRSTRHRPAVLNGSAQSQERAKIG